MDHDYLDDNDREANEELKAMDQRIRRMLASAPANRSWRRRGLFVLACSHLARMSWQRMTMMVAATGAPRSQGEATMILSRRVAGLEMIWPTWEVWCRSWLNWMRMKCSPWWWASFELVPLQVPRARQRRSSMDLPI